MKRDLVVVTLMVLLFTAFVTLWDMKRDPVWAVDDIDCDFETIKDEGAGWARLIFHTSPCVVKLRRVP